MLFHCERVLSVCLLSHAYDLVEIVLVWTLDQSALSSMHAFLTFPVLHDVEIENFDAFQVLQYVSVVMVIDVETPGHCPFVFAFLHYKDTGSGFARE